LFKSDSSVTFLDLKYMFDAVDCVCREDRARLAADMKSLKAAHDKQWLDAGTKYVTGDASTQQQMTPTTNRQTGTEIDRQAAADEQESGDWLEVEKRVSSAGYVDIAAVSTTEMELKRRVDKLSSMITEVCITPLCVIVNSMSECELILC